MVICYGNPRKLRQSGCTWVSSRVPQIKCSLSPPLYSWATHWSHTPGMKQAPLEVNKTTWKKLISLCLVAYSATSISSCSHWMLTVVRNWLGRERQPLHSTEGETEAQGGEIYYPESPAVAGWHGWRKEGMSLHHLVGMEMGTSFLGGQCEAVSFIFSKDILSLPNVPGVGAKEGSALN